MSFSYINTYRNPSGIAGRPVRHVWSCPNGYLVVKQFPGQSVNTVKFWFGSDLNEMVRYWTTNVAHPAPEAARHALSQVAPLVLYAIR